VLSPSGSFHLSAVELYFGLYSKPGEDLRAAKMGYFLIHASWKL
jgi:hypothetical protein